MLPGLKAIITAETDEFVKGVDGAVSKIGNLDKATARTSRSLRRFGDVTTNLGKKMSVVSGGVIAGAVGMFALAKGTATAGDRIAKTARGAGIGADAFQELTFALGQAAGMSERELASSLERLTRRMGQAVDGNKQLSEAFEGIGISMQAIQDGSVDTEGAFNTIIAAMQSAETNAEAAAIGMQFFGREGAALGPQLRESGADIDALRQQARDLGIVMGGETLKASEDFADKMGELAGAAQGLRNRIGSALIPIALRFMDTLQDKVIPAVISMVSHIESAIEWFGGLPAPVQEAAAIIAGALGAGGPVLLAIGAMSKALGALVAFTGPVGLFIAAATLAWLAWQKWGDDIKDLIASVAEWFEVKFNEVIEFFKSLPERFAEFGRNIIDGLLAGINEKWEALKERIMELGEMLPEWLRERLGIASPSKVMHDIGVQIGEGLADGIAETQGMIAQAMAQTIAPIENSALSAAKSVVNSMDMMFNKSKPIAIAQGLINTWQGITEALKLPFPQNIAAAAKVASVGFAAVDGIRGTSKGGGGGKRGGSSDGGGSISTQRVDLNIVGGNDRDRIVAREIISVLNEAARDDMRLDARLIGV